MAVPSEVGLGVGVRRREAIQAVYEDPSRSPTPNHRWNSEQHWCTGDKTFTDEVSSGRSPNGFTSWKGQELYPIVRENRVEGRQVRR